MKPKWMKIFDDILPALIGVVLFLDFAFPSKDRLFLIFSGIALVSNSLTRIIERHGDSND